MMNLMWYLLPIYSEFKKEDIKNFVRRSRKWLAVQSVIFLLSNTFLLFGVLSGLKLARNVGAPLPLSAQVAPFVLGTMIGILFVAAVYFFRTQPDHGKLDNILGQYADNEMIKGSKIPDIKRYALYEILIYVAFVILIVYAPVSVFGPLLEFLSTRLMQN